MASVDKHGKKWRVRWRIPVGGDETRPGSASFNDKKTADAHKRWVEDELAGGRTGELRRDGEAPLIGEAMTGYTEHLAVVREPSTATKQGYTLDVFSRFLEAKYRGPVLVSHLSRQMLIDFHVWLGAGTGRHGRSRSSETKRKAVEIVQLFWEWCFDHDGEVGKHTPRPRKLDLKRSPGKPPVAPRWAEMDRAIAWANAWYPFLLTVLRFTGLRVQQAMHLRASDIDLEAATLLVRPELGKSSTEKHGRVIPLAPSFVELLEALFAFGLLSKDAPFLIPSGRHKGIRERLARGVRIALAWEKAEVRPEVWKGRPHHCFRKGFKSELTRAGADDRATEYLLGHDMGLGGVYTDPDALPMRASVATIPFLHPAAHEAVVRSLSVVSRGADAVA